MRLGDATREYVANKQATGMVFEGEAYVLRAFRKNLGANMPIKKITSDSVLDYLNGHGPITLFCIVSTMTQVPCTSVTLAALGHSLGSGDGLRVLAGDLRLHPASSDQVNHKYARSFA